MKKNDKIAIIGLGYVGLPLAVEFAKKYKVLGYDIDLSRTNELARGNDETLEVTSDDLNNIIQKSPSDIGLSISSNFADLKDYNIYIITVPTPINEFNLPDLKPLISASKTIGEVLDKGDIVIYESTVYPGCTEEECIPVLEKYSSLKFNYDFFCGYSPERINPGDKINTLTTIRKVTSGSTPEIATFVDDLYNSIIDAGTFKASSIKVAEASKAIENAQRDLNIAFVNELSKIFNKIGIDTLDVLEAASTKWNFINLKPGLVGGHCIGVDPFYLVHKSLSVGYNPELIVSARKLNESMGLYVANRMMKLILSKNLLIKHCKILILGVTFKENCPDIRNTKIVDVYNNLKKNNVDVDIYDPIADELEVQKHLGIQLINKISINDYDGIIAGVAHSLFKEIDFEAAYKSGVIIYDLKGSLPRKYTHERL
tara:strand:- start:10055 stop:11338 length:1284 start_codon:yes stop_codon:yes gene_type:complete